PPPACAVACTRPSTVSEPFTTIDEYPALADPPVPPLPPCAKAVTTKPLKSAELPPKIASPSIFTLFQPPCADPPLPEPVVPPPMPPPTPPMPLAIARKVDASIEAPSASEKMLLPPSPEPPLPPTPQLQPPPPLPPIPRAIAVMP